MCRRFGFLLLLLCLAVASCRSSGAAGPPSGGPSPGTGAPPNPNPAPAPPPPPSVTPAPPPPPQPTAPPAAAPAAPAISASAASGVYASSASPAAPAAPPPAASVPPQAPAAVVPNRPSQDIIKLKQAAFSDEFLLNKIRTENINYQLTTTDILELRNAGLSEPVIEAMMRSGQPVSVTAGSPVARKAEFAGLARVGKGFLVFGTSTSKNVGRLVVDGDKISWYEAEDPKKNFSIYAKNAKEIFNTCVLRPEQNLCLEFGIVTYTGEEYRFRDPGWKKGDNRLILEATSYFRQAFPYLFFSQRAVNEL
jgi:hypothetical protein